MKSVLSSLALVAVILSSPSAFAEDTLPAFRAGVAPADQFPDVRHATVPQGVFVPSRHLALIAPGLRKSAVYTLLDVPHFHEGLIGVHRWNYIINFYTGQGDEFRQCQFQIRFGSHNRVESTWWRDEECSDLYLGALVRVREIERIPSVATTPTPSPSSVASEERAVRAYSLTFAFNRFDINDNGRKVIAEVVREVQAGHYHRIVATGFTDTVGSTGYNDGLSARRAATIVAALSEDLAQAGSPLARQTFSRGGRDLAIRTGPNVSEEKNRRAVIELY